MLKWIKKIMNTWKRLDQIECDMHQVNQYILDQKTQKAQDMINPPPVTFSEESGAPWLIITDDKLESMR